MIRERIPWLIIVICIYFLAERGLDIYENKLNDNCTRECCQEDE